MRQQSAQGLPAYSSLDKRQRISDLRYVDENSLD
jgi:hypothetical protein